MKNITILIFCSIVATVFIVSKVAFRQNKVEEIVIEQVKVADLEPSYTEEAEVVEYEYGKYLNSVKGHIEVDTIRGDFNGDGKQEYAWIRRYSNTFTDNDSLEVLWYVEFSDKSIPRWTETWNIRPSLVYEGDIDQNGVDEFGILDTWNASVYRSYKILTYHENSWRFLVKPWLTTEASRESGKELAYPTDRKGYIRITFDEIIDLYRCVRDTVVEATFEKTY